MIQYTERDIPVRVFKTLLAVRDSGVCNMWFSKSVIYNTMYFDWWSYRWLKVFSGKHYKNYGYVLEQFSKWLKTEEREID